MKKLDFTKYNVTREVKPVGRICGYITQNNNCGKNTIIWNAMFVYKDKQYFLRQDTSIAVKEYEEVEPYLCGSFSDWILFEVIYDMIPKVVGITIAELEEMNGCDIW